MGQKVEEQNRRESRVKQNGKSLTGAENKEKQRCRIEEPGKAEQKELDRSRKEREVEVQNRKKRAGVEQNRKERAGEN